MIFRKSSFGDGRVGVDDAEDFFADAQRRGQHRAYALQGHGAAHQARVLLRVRCEDGFAKAHNLFHDRAADANLSDFALTISEARDSDFQLFAALVPHHDAATLRWHGLED